MSNERIDTLQDAIVRLRRDNQRLTEQHGSGIRPAWVGEDIGMNNARIQQYEQELKELQEQNLGSNGC